MTVSPWPIHVPDGVLDDLRRRLDRVRFPDELSDIGWDDGTPLAYVRELVEYWRGAYDWRAQERMLNERLPSFRAEIGGLGIHFAHLPGKGPDPFPLLLIHGWPGSYFEMYKIAGPLADPAAHGGDPADAFHVVVPSIPGHGFSDAPREPGFNADRAADVFRDLMVDTLGYPRFGAQGGDRGAFVSAGLGSRHPANVAGIHLNMGLAIPSPEAERGPEERAWLERQAAWRAAEGGYMGIQSTKPQTLGYGLNDSPAGLAAWIVEKWRAWSDCGGDVERRFTKDELLTNVMIYWVTGTIRSSAHFYYEHRRRPPAAVRPVAIDTPAAAALFPADVSQPPRVAVERKFPDLRRYTVFDRGGHFASMEEPELLIEDVRAFFRPLRTA